MKKVGIITMYYNSLNYGGLLQAYALQKKVESFNVICEQISFNKTVYSSLYERFILKKNESGLLFAIKWAFTKTFEKVYSIFINMVMPSMDKKELSLKKVKMSQFRESIPHTIKVSENDINILNEKFDVFICGSDQIWKPGVICNEFLLKFVSSDKRKAAYAASISNSKIIDSDLKMIIDNTNDYSAVGIREKQDVDLINRNGGNACWVLDPTLLLTRDDWDTIVSERLVDNDYLFVYLLGKNRKCKNIIKKYAKMNNLKIVNLKYASGEIKELDDSFGDYNFINISPGEFISLIKNANCVITDSFHASVFSIIYNKLFFTIQRVEEVTMENRIKSLFSIFNINNRFIKIDELLDYCDDDSDIKDYLNDLEYLKMKKYSEDFLISIIK